MPQDHLKVLKALKNIQHDLSLAKELAFFVHQAGKEAKTKTFRRECVNFDPSVSDELLSLAKGRVKELSISYHDLGAFYKQVTGKEYVNLSKRFLVSFYLERISFN